MHIRFPFEIDHKGQTAQSDDDRYIRDLIEQVLFTAPGERVNRPSFGSGLLQLVFQPNSNELSATVQFLIQGALQQWLADLIIVNQVEVDNDDALLAITVVYTNRRSQKNPGRYLFQDSLMATQFFCKNKVRWKKVRESNSINGIDYLEVAAFDQKQLKVYFLHNLPASLEAFPAKTAARRSSARRTCLSVAAYAFATLGCRLSRYRIMSSP